MKLKLPLTPLPKQELFLKCPADNILFGGAVGGGKTKIAVLKAYMLAMTYQNIHIGIFRRSLTEIRESVQNYCFEMIPRHLYHYTETKRTFRFHSTGSRITLNYLENIKDLMNYEGWEFQVIIIDEAVRFTPYLLSKINGRLRAGRDIGFKPKVYYLTNPIGVGAGYLKSKFVSGKNPMKIYNEDESFTTPEGTVIKSTRSYCYIPSTIWDNPYILENDPEYIARLNELPETERLALMNGIWDSPAFIFFHMFNPDRHIIDEYIPSIHDELYICCDWGTAKPFSVSWYAVQPSGHVIKYREYYGQKGKIPDEGCGMQANDVAAESMRRTPLEEHILMAILDNSCWSNTGHGKTISEMFHEEFIKRDIPVAPCKKDRINGLELIKYYLSKEKDGVPLLRITRSCSHTIRVINELVPSEKRDGDVAEDSEDHITDDLYYFLFSRPRPKDITPQTYFGTMAKYDKDEKR